MKKLPIIAAASLLLSACEIASPDVTVVDGSNEEVITYIGRIDRADWHNPRQWAAAGYFTFAFEGKGCEIDIADMMQWGKDYNYLEFQVDTFQTRRVRTYGQKTTFVIGNAVSDSLARDSTVVRLFPELTSGRHTVLVCRNTETGMGYTEVVNIRAKGAISKWTPEANLRIEFIGNSITSGDEMYMDEIPFPTGEWYDRHRAYYSYGPRTARNLNAQWSLASMSGIGIIQSCCNHKSTMPEVYDKVVFPSDTIDYDFSFHPDIVCICLGQNDGIQDTTAFLTAYVDLIGQIRANAPESKIVLLNSPMDHGDLNNWLTETLIKIEAAALEQGHANISHFFFSKAWNKGGAGHPNMDEHAEIAEELTTYLKQLL